MKISLPAAVLLTLSASCVVDTPDEGSDELGATAAIRGTDINRHHLESGAVLLKPIDLRTVAIEAQIERSSGTFDVHTGTGTSAGTFAIAGVPTGRTYWLRIGASWYLTRERHPEVGTDQLGRPDATPAAPGSSLVLSADGLTPVTDADDFQLQAANAGVGFYSTAGFFNPFTANAPAPGDTTLSGAVLPFDADPNVGTSQFPLVEAARGDTLMITQLTTLQSGDIPYSSLSRAGSATVTMVQGAPTAITATLTAPPTSTTTTVDYRATGFESQAEAMGPGSTVFSSAIFVDANQTGLVAVGGTPDLAFANLTPGTGDQVIAMAYRNPFPASWPRFLTPTLLFRVPFVAPSPTGGTIVRNTFLSAFSQVPVTGASVRGEPLVTPPLAIAIDGHGRESEVQVTGATPVITWDAPAQGRPAASVVRVRQLNATSPFNVNVARLVVDGDTRRVRIPRGIMQSGTHYNIRVTAIVSADLSPDSRLEPRFAFPSGSATAQSHTIRVE